MSERTKIALLFPGQGSQKEGMEDLVAAHAPELHEAAIELVGANPFELAAEATRFAQPAIFCASLAGWISAGRPDADYMAGHSLGDLTALTAAGAFALEDGLRLAVERGRLMEEAAHGSKGAMVAVMGDADVARSVADRCGVVVANDNAPGQLVLSGAAEAIAAATELAEANGLKTISLRVSGAFHSDAVAPAAEPFRELVAATPTSPLRMPVISCTSARPFGEHLAAELAAALTAPVLWRQVVVELAAAGSRVFVDVGPGRALRGLVKRTLADVEAVEIRQIEELSGVGV